MVSLTCTILTTINDVVVVVPENRGTNNGCHVKVHLQIPSSREWGLCMTSHLLLEGGGHIFLYVGHLNGYCNLNFIMKALSPNSLVYVLDCK